MKQFVSLWVLGGALALSACSKQGSDAPKAQPEAKPETVQVAPAPLEVLVQNAWVRPTVVGQKATGAYFVLTANQDARVLSGSTPVAASLELHEMKMDGDVMRMRKLDNGIPLPANQAVELKPGGYHVMLLDLTQAVQAGQEVPMTLVVQKSEQSGGGTQEVLVKAVVRSMDSDASMPAAPAAAHGEHHH